VQVYFYPVCENVILPVMVFENRFLKKALGTNNENANGEYRKSYKEEIPNLYFTKDQ
jgi:hypothetical protein